MRQLWCMILFKLRVSCSGVETHEMILIDALVHSAGDAVSQLWKNEDGSGLYPPPSLHVSLSFDTIRHVAWGAIVSYQVEVHGLWQGHVFIAVVWLLVGVWIFQWRLDESVLVNESLTYTWNETDSLLKKWSKHLMGGGGGDLVQIKLFWMGITHPESPDH